MVVLAAAYALRPGRSGGGRKLASVAILVVAASCLFGSWEHIESNRHAGRLDKRYAETWTDLSAGTQWLKALTMDVGKSPPLVPMTMLLSAVLVGAAALTSVDSPEPGREVETEPANQE